MISRLLSSWNLTKTVLLVTVIGIAIYFALSGFTEATLRTVVRLTARMSGLLFCMAFTASSFNQIVRNSFSKWMLKNRRYIGVSFALVHLIHLGFIISLQMVFKTVIPATKLFTIVGGGVAYVFVVAMLFTSFNRFSSKLSKMQWTLLHTVGGYWIWAVFIFSYLKRAVNDYLYLALSILFAVVLLVRLFGKRPADLKLVSG